jgi:hypothetical protein
VWFLKGQCWDWVQCHCGQAVVRRLCRLGLLRRGADTAAIVHDTVSLFCTIASAVNSQPLRQVLEATNPIALLTQVR